MPQLHHNAAFAADLPHFDSSDPIRTLLGRYQKACEAKRALQERLRHSSGINEPSDSPKVVQAATTALERHRVETQVVFEHPNLNARSESEYSGNYIPVMHDLDGPREEAVDDWVARNIDDENDTLPSPSAGDLSEYTPSDGQTCHPITPAAASLSGPNPSTLDQSILDFINSPFAQYDEMIQDLQSHSLTVTFLRREEIPWPILSRHGVFPVELEGKKSITFRALEDFVIEYSAWEGQPLAKTVVRMCRQWTAIHDRLKEAHCAKETRKPASNEENTQIYHWITKVCLVFWAIMDARGIRDGECVPSKYCLPTQFGTRSRNLCPLRIHYSYLPFHASSLTFNPLANST